MISGTGLIMHGTAPAHRGGYGDRVRNLARQSSGAHLRTRRELRGPIPETAQARPRCTEVKINSGTMTGPHSPGGVIRDAVVLANPVNRYRYKRTRRAAVHGG
jgi:hypothetical protein